VCKIVPVLHWWQGQAHVASRPEAEESTCGKGLQEQGTCPGLWQQGEGMEMSLVGFASFWKMHQQACTK